MLIGTMAVSVKSLQLALQNIAQHGDTDVFPFPIENHWFHDQEDEIVRLLEAIDADFKGYLGAYPLFSVTSLSSVGYAGFRGATQIDALWNAYLLALVIEIAPELEAARVARSENVTFSYRFHPNIRKATLFDSDLGWGSFQRTALAKAETHAVILSTDISDFYPRVYHHRLQHALEDATQNTEVVRRILTLLGKLSPGTVSFGLPVGGHAARMLAEAVLNRSDRLLLTTGVDYCRFVDDYYIFADSREDAQSALIHLSEVLLSNEGLTLSRLKTRFMTSSEFVRSSPMADPEASDSIEERDSRRFLKLRLRYDPYSSTAEDDYERLAEGIAQFDVVGMLARELRKTRVDERLVKHLIKSLKFLDKSVRDDAAISLVRNLEVLYPVFPTVALVMKSVLPDLSPAARDEVFGAFRRLITARSYITLVPTNLAYAVRVIAQDSTDEATTVLSDIYSEPKANALVKRDVILAMAKKKVKFWLSDVAKKSATLSRWEKRALIVASFVLGDEGNHWRRNTLPRMKAPDAEPREGVATLTPPADPANALPAADLVELAFARWVSSNNNGRRWDIPL